MNQLTSTSLKLPQHWRWERLEDLGQWGSGGTPRRSVDDYFGGDIPWLKIGDLTDGIVDTSEESLTERGLEESAAKMIPAGSLLIGMYGSIGKLGISRIPCATNQAIAHCLPNNSTVNTKYLFWALFFYRPELEDLGKGGTQQNISQTVLKDFCIPVPPVEEQRRIVFKIEELFSNLDAGLHSLQTAKRQSERYRQSVLQAAVEGRLTANWRRTHRPKPADQLLKRILQERREQWGDDYRKKYQSKGKKPPEGWRSRYSSPAGPENSNLPDMPAGWKWATVEQISIVYSGVTKNASKSGDLVSMPYLRVANVYANELRLDDVREIKVRRSRLYKYLLQEGDLLVVEGNGSKSQIGRVARWDGSLDPCVHQNHLIKVRPVIAACGRYLLLWMLSPAGRRHIMRVASSTSGLYTLSLTKVRNIPVPLPPLSEQREIVDEVSRLLSIGDDLVNTLEGEEQRGGRLRQSILKKAFSGRLVPTGAETDPDGASGMNDKSATEMHVDA